MSGDARPAGQAAQRVGSGATRISRAWRKLPPERRLAAGAAVGLFVTLFLPWYQDTVILSGTGRVANLRLTSASITGWGAFSFVEAAVLLVAAGVLTLLFMRAEGRAFHVPAGDGGVVTAAGVWTCLLIVWRIFDKQGAQSNHGQYLTTTGIEWGIFIALGVAGLLAYAGSRIRLAHEPEPPLPGEGAEPVRRPRGAAMAAGPGKSQPRTPPPVAAGEPWSDEAPTRRPELQEAPTARMAPDPSTRHPPTDQAPTRSMGPANETPRRRARPGDRPAAARDFEFPDIDELDVEDPPTARLGRSSRRARPPADGVPPSDHQW